MQTKENIVWSLFYNIYVLNLFYVYLFHIHPRISSAFNTKNFPLAANEIILKEIFFVKRLITLISFIIVSLEH